MAYRAGTRGDGRRLAAWLAVVALVVPAVAACGDGDEDVAPPLEAGAVIELVADDLSFDQETITVPSGVEVLVRLRNEDSVTHNFSIYRSGRADPPRAEDLVLLGEIVAMMEAETFAFTTPDEDGTYFFRCDIHPTLMTGDFVVR